MPLIIVLLMYGAMVWVMIANGSGYVAAGLFLVTMFLLIIFNIKDEDERD